MPGIKDRVAIIGMGCTKFGERWDMSVADLLVEAAYEAYEDAGIDPDKDIKAAWIGTTGSGATGQMLATPLKLEYIPITRVENACATGTDAFRNACYAVAAGIYDIVLAAGVEKLKDAPWTGLGMGGIMSSGVMTSAPPPVQFALAATRYAHHDGIPMDELKRGLARIAVKNPDPSKHYEWCRTPDVDIDRWKALGFDLEQDKKVSKGLHGQGDSRIVVGDAVLMSTSKENFEILEELKAERKAKRARMDAKKDYVRMAKRRNPVVPVLDPLGVGDSEEE